LPWHRLNLKKLSNYKTAITSGLKTAEYPPAFDSTTSPEHLKLPDLLRLFPRLTPKIKRGPTHRCSFKIGQAGIAPACIHPQTFRIVLADLSLERVTVHAAGQTTHDGIEPPSSGFSPALYH
jgi:hypothetical protein